MEKDFRDCGTSIFPSTQIYPGAGRGILMAIAYRYMNRHAIYIVEDNEFVRGTLQEFIEMDTDLRVCGTAASAEAALEALPDVDADLLVIDISLPGISGIELAGEVKARWPEVPCLMLSGHQETTYARRALAAGAQGYVLKGEPGAISDAIRAVLDGETYVSARLRSKLAK